MSTRELNLLEGGRCPSVKVSQQSMDQLRVWRNAREGIGMREGSSPSLQTKPYRQEIRVTPSTSPRNLLYDITLATLVLVYPYLIECYLKYSEISVYSDSHLRPSFVAQCPIYFDKRNNLKLRAQMSTTMLFGHRKRDSFAFRVTVH